MKLTYFASLLTAGLVGICSATTGIDWNDPSGAVGSNIPSPGPMPDGSVWALYYSADMTADPVDPFGALTGTNDDVLLLVANNGAGSFGKILPTDLPGNNTVQQFGSGGQFIGGSVFTRVFNTQQAVDSSNPGTWNITIPNNTEFYTSGLSGPTPDFDGVNDPPPLQHLYAGGGIAFAGETFTAIPEPSSLAMVFIGLATMARIFRRK